MEIHWPDRKKLGWDKKTNAIICPDHVSETKPNPEGRIACSKKLDADLEKSFYIGDHCRDIETGKKCGHKNNSVLLGLCRRRPKSLGSGLHGKQCRGTKRMDIQRVKRFSPSKNFLEGKNILVTGAGSGIGKR